MLLFKIVDFLIKACYSNLSNSFCPTVRSLCLRFDDILGQPKGNWDNPESFMIFQKELEDKYLLFKGVCNVNLMFKNKIIPYKYVIYKGGSNEIEWEVLPKRYLWSNGNVNRCLIIGNCNEQFTKYDDAITKHSYKDGDARKVTFKALLNLCKDRLYKNEKLELFVLAQETMDIRNSYADETKAQKLIDNDQLPYHRYVTNFS